MKSPATSHKNTRHPLRTLLLILSAVTVLTACASRPALPPGHILLLGEVHDNPDGHRQRHADLRELVEGGWRPAIVMEQFDREQQDLLAQAQADCADADCVIRKVGGKRWEWMHYRPIIELALRHHLPLVAANVSRADVARVMREGMAAALPPETIAAFGLTAPLPADVASGQRLAIENGHCGQIPAAMVQGMVNAQVVRDVWMAQALLNNRRTGAVLIAGNGHVRSDIGVPRWLAGRADALFQTHGYLEAGPLAEAGTFDRTHAIAPHQRPDPCATLDLPSLKK